MGPRLWKLRAESDGFQMISLLSIIAVGFFLGMRHATDPDHVIAVTTIVSGQPNLRQAALTGTFWGVGHTLTIFVVGAAIILFNLVIPARVGLSMELSVGLMLIVLGLMNVASFLRSMPATALHTQEGVQVIHSHPHSHGDYIHSHAHRHAPEAHSHTPEQTPLGSLDRAFSEIGVYQYVRPLIVGVVHGLAGSAAITLLVLTTIHDSRWAIAYLLVFGIGTIAGMMLITMSISSTFRFVGSNYLFSRRLGMASGLLSLLFGLVLAYQICLVNGLFTSHPQWTPR